MKYLIVLIFSFMILSVELPILTQCDFGNAKIAVPPILWAEQSADPSNQNTRITRFLHNKATVFLAQSAKCYFNVYDPLFIYKSTGMAGAFFWFYFIYFALEKKKKMLILFFTLLPIMPFFNLLGSSTVIFHKIFAIAGAGIFINKHL